VIASSSHGEASSDSCPWPSFRYDALDTAPSETNRSHCRPSMTAFGGQLSAMSRPSRDIDACTSSLSREKGDTRTYCWRSACRGRQRGPPPRREPAAAAAHDLMDDQHLWVAHAPPRRSRNSGRPAPPLSRPRGLADRKDVIVDRLRQTDHREPVVFFPGTRRAPPQRCSCRRRRLCGGCPRRPFTSWSAQPSADPGLLDESALHAVSRW